MKVLSHSIAVDATRILRLVLILNNVPQVLISLGDFMTIEVHACVGGTAVRDDIAKLRTGVHVVVGTPGRVFDMINRRGKQRESERDKSF
jgi:translation initiation factor 4A